MALIAATLKPVLGISLADEHEETMASALVIAPYGMKDGRPVDAQEARGRYHRDVTAEPSRADLRVRYANVLRALDEREEAASEYRAALRLDAANVEACLRLGELAQEDEDLSKARRFFERVLDLAPKSGLPVRLQDRYTESARAALAELDAPVGVQVATGALADTLDSGPLSRPLEPFVQQQPIVRGPKVGRNEPCPCGSGRKYKRCCRR
jgi:tetratricopeptide (TPR) repeat protein